jgi:hypothetical protein
MDEAGANSPGHLEVGLSTRKASVSWELRVRGDVMESHSYSLYGLADELLGLDDGWWDGLY